MYSRRLVTDRPHVRAQIWRDLGVETDQTQLCRVATMFAKSNRSQFSRLT
jgi:hypothetical protein